MKKFIFLFFSLLIILLITGCRGDGRMNQMDIETRIKLNYFINFWMFDSHFVWDGMWFDINNIRNRELIFVHSEDAALAYGFPLDKVIGFPSPCTWGALNQLNNMNFNFTHLAENGISLDKLGLAFPFTIEHVVDNWQNMEIFIMRALTPDERTAIRRHSNSLQYKRDTRENRVLRSLLFPGRLDAINELIIGRDTSSVDTERINNSRGTNYTIDDLPLLPFTEDDVRSNPWLIQSMLMQLLNSDEWRSVDPEEILRRQLEQIR